jgi:hypothetical protein
MLSLLNRMCWNSRGWRLPTNTSGDGGYPSKMGFGHEEWNFQTQDEVDGCVYGYLYYRPALKVIEQSDGHFRIFFWGIHPDTRKRLVVGTYADATLATNDDYEKVDAAFTKRDIYRRRATELSAAVSKMAYEEALREVIRSVRKHWLNFKCPVDSVHPLAEYIPVHEITNTALGMYFARPTFIPSVQLSDIPHRPVPSSRGKPFAQNIAALAEDAYCRESTQNLRLIIRRHNRLSNAFAFWLKHAGFSKILQEQDYVDIVFEQGDKVYRAELKICYGVGSTKAIREALGQLLEYNFYPGRATANQWAIVLDEKATTDDVEYIRHLKDKINLPLSLGWQEGQDFVFADGLEL